MAESGKQRISQGNVFHIHIHGENTVEESTVVEGDQVKNITEIENSNIETVLSGYSGSGGNDDGLEGGVRGMNLEQTVSDRITQRPQRQQHTHLTQGQHTTQPIGGKMTETQRENLIKISFLKGKAYAHVQNRNYLEGKKVLDEIQSSQDEHDLDILLLMAECALHLGSRSTDKCIQMLRDMILSCSVLKAREIEFWGDELKKNGRNVGSILLYWISSDKYKTESTDLNDVITYIKGRAFDIEAPSKALSKFGDRSRIIVIDYVIEFLIGMLDYIRSATGTGLDTKAVMEGNCLDSIGVAYLAVKEYPKSIAFRSMGIEILEKRFGENASKCKIYGVLLHNVATAYYNLRRFAEAEPFYIRAIEATSKANDFSDENAKQKSIESSKADLADTRRELSKLK